MEALVVTDDDGRRRVELANGTTTKHIVGITGDIAEEEERKKRRLEQMQSESATAAGNLDADQQHTQRRRELYRQRLRLAQCWARTRPRTRSLSSRYIEEQMIRLGSPKPRRRRTISDSEFGQSPVDPHRCSSSFHRSHLPSVDSKSHRPMIESLSILRPREPS